jgi:hypothetical protein
VVFLLTKGERTMSKPDEVIRLYKMPDSEMITTSRVIHTQFIKDKPLFIQFDSDFADPFSSRWDNSITLAEDAGRNIDVTGEQVHLTEVVTACMEKCKTHFQKSKYYIEKAFPDDPVKWNLFGYEEYDSARRGESRMIPFMKAFHTEAVKNKVKLIEAGYTQEKIDEIKSLWEELLNADNMQEVFIREKPVVTQGRVETLNAAWEFVMKVNRASKDIFADDYAKLQQYVISDDSTGGDNAAGTPPAAPPAK